VRIGRGRPKRPRVRRSGRSGAWRGRSGGDDMPGVTGPNAGARSRLQTGRAAFLGVSAC
jgi:hypothetical protein